MSGSLVAVCISLQGFIDDNFDIFMQDGLETLLKIMTSMPIENTLQTAKNSTTEYPGCVPIMLSDSKLNQRGLSFIKIATAPSWRIVEENNIVCPVGEHCLIISFICAAKYSSNTRSASSKIKIWMFLTLKEVGVFWKWSMSRPGVAMTVSGAHQALLLAVWNPNHFQFYNPSFQLHQRKCLKKPYCAHHHIVCIFVKWAHYLATWNTCRGNSLVGSNTSTRVTGACQTWCSKRSNTRQHEASSFS